MEKPLYIKEFSRDFCLPVIELWCKGESTEPQQWTQEVQPKIPYIVFERTSDTVVCYMDPAGIAWNKEEIIRKINKDEKYIDWLCDLVEEKMGKVRGIYENPKALNQKELVNFLNLWNDAYPPFNGMWWMMEVLSEIKHPKFIRTKKLREMTDRMSTGSDLVVRLSLKSLYPELGKYYSVLTIEEIKNINVPSRAELVKRYKHYIYTNDKLYVDKTLSDIEKEFNIILEVVEPYALSIIRGQVAYKGKVSGVVKRIMGSAQNDKLQIGEILVTSMTMPDMTPAMKKASAFVTDEGGITCHAAIIAREMKKPCIIGTKIATKVLKDGDLVEVDANKGIVKILKR